ncbi:chromate transporter, chromate ion transporter (CHR) family [Gemmatirosa kalamazoonensis]|uniref:Chromate transporter, chromate ion transporter (CHR) family n=1 Tax=Gemmatirosa kalamazoonensis TaxID=861299 RepID=W0RF13_9BACT|nr:chromate efflux transporter [Gemmatirosa kalamazoonensis]AHG89381.1 chromate transporter, chromate ion transporter (CHR) family [Gemmatirosa kalamazoonensis]
MPDPTRPSLRALARYFLRLGAAGFGGPIALVGYMERAFVDEHGWVSRQELKDGLAFAQLAPGPLAAQLAIYLGWLCAGLRGATVAGIAFVGPSFVMVVALAALYVRFGGMVWLQGAFYGIGAAVIAIIARSVVKLVRTTVGPGLLLRVLCATSALVTAWTESELLWLFVGCGLVSLGAQMRWRGRAGALALVPPWLVTGLGTTASASLVGTLFVFFASAGLFVFGSGLAIVPFLHGGVVLQHHWLTERQFLDAVAVALITPGPVVITVAFIGYLVAGTLGATAAAAGVFAPVYLITVLLAPRYERWKSDPRARAFVDGVTAAATGAIAGAAVVLGRRAIVDAPTAVIAAATLALLLRFRRLPEPLVIVAAGALGIAIRAA